MKKAVMVILAGILVIGSLAACGTDADTNDVKKNAAANVSSIEEGEGKGAKSENASDEIVEIVWQYPSPGSLGVGFQDVENAINEKMEADIGVHVTFEPVELMESQQKALLMITSGEQLDIVLSAFTSIGPLVSSNSIIPLTELADKYGQDMVADGIELSKGYYNGELYGIPPIESKGRAYGYILKTEYLDKYGIEVDEDKYYTLDDLEEIFEIIKAGEGDNFYCCIPANMTPEPAANGYVEYDKIGGSLADGVIMLNKSFDNLTVTNFFETEEYRGYAEKMYEWAQKGYIAADAAVTTETNDTLIPSSHYLGNFYWGEDFERAIYENTAKTPMTTLKMLDGYVVNGGGAGCQWSISANCEYPDKAMQALNYLYHNYDVNMLVQYGLEGVSYEISEETEDGIQIKYLAEDTASLPYFNPYGLWGNQFNYPAVYPLEPGLGKEKHKFSEGIPKERYSAAMGYNFNQEPVSSQIAAVETVIAQYTPSLNCGALDPAKALPEFIESLKAAGIDTIIEENQRQLDEWAASNK